MNTELMLLLYTDGRPILHLREIAGLLGIEPKMVQRAIHSSAMPFPCFTLGVSPDYVAHVSDVAAYLDDQRRTAIRNATGSSQPREESLVPIVDSEIAPSSTARWVTLAKHCADTGDTSHAVHSRRKRHEWIDGVQCRLGPNGKLYINPEERDRWVEGSSHRK